MRLAILGSPHPASLPPAVGIELEQLPLRVAAFARTPYDHLFVEIAHIDGAERAETMGFDGILLDTFADYGIERMRHSVSIPVYGAGEEGIRAAGADGRRYSVVTVWPTDLAYIYEERLASCEGGATCAGVHFFSAAEELELIASPDGVQARMGRQETALVDALAQACRDAVQADGSDAVLCGCTCMAPIGPLLQERCEFPILECSRIGQAAAMTALRHGAAPAGRTLSPRRGDVRALVDLWLGEDASGPDAVDELECAPCAVVSAVQHAAG